MIPFIDLSPQHDGIKREILDHLEQEVRSAQFILGPSLRTFEEEMARYHDVRHAVGVASGTDALLLSLLAAGVGEGDEVVTSPFTFVATAEVIVHAGAKPVFADIDENTFNLDPAQVDARLTARTKALIPVHLYGLAADMNTLGSIAGRKNVPIVEDCAQSTGAKIGDRLAGTFGDAAAFSFFPTKNLGAFGDGGMVLTESDVLAEKVKRLRGHGSSERDNYELPGYNSRLDSIQAAVLSIKLRHLESWNRLRRKNASLYRHLLGDLEEIRLPGEPEGFTHVYNQFTIMTERREDLRRYLEKREIGTMVYYSRALHRQPVFSDLGYIPGDFPVAEKAQDQVLSLPVYPGLPEESLRKIAEAIRSFFGST